MRLRSATVTWSILGGRIPLRKYRDEDRIIPVTWDVLYSDNDVCIIADKKDSYAVYTKNEAYLRTGARRKLRMLLSYLPQLVLRWIPVDSGRASSDDSIFSISPSKNLRVLKLGGSDSTDDEEEAWEGLKDPFVHLSAEERQRVLKSLSVTQIEAMGREKEKQSRRERMIRWMKPKGPKNFDKPKA